MDKEIFNELEELYNILIETGITFYYGNEEIEFGEITNINFDEDIEVEIDFNKIYKVSLEDFKDSHHKEGATYYNWNQIRYFDDKISEIINGAAAQLS